ncbi:MAG: hypothetical protein ACLU9X_07300 [Alistipes shahii]
MLDTIDNVARRTFTRTVLADSLIRVGSLRDTARLSFSARRASRASTSLSAQIPRRLARPQPSRG